MRIYLDLDSRLILSSPTRPLSTLEFKRRDTDLLELQFVRSGAVVEVSSSTSVRYGLKAADQYAADFLSTGSFAKTGTGTAAVYTASFSLNTQPIAEAFDAEPKSISAMLEVEYSDGTTVSSSNTLSVTLHNDVIRGDEGTPVDLPSLKANQSESEAGISNDKWMTPLRTAQAIAALGAGGGGATSWASISGKPSTFPPESHQHALSDLSASGAASGQVPTWNGTAWTPQTPSTGGGGGGVSSWNDLTDKPSTFPPATHDHDGRYYTETEMDTLLAGKQPTGSYATAEQGAKADSALQSGTAIANISGLQTALDGKQAAGSYAPATGISPTAITGTAVVDSDSRLSDSRTPLSHTHGNITNAGAIGTTASLPIITGAGGVLQAGSFGTTAGTFAAGDHTHSNFVVNGGNVSTIVRVTAMPATPVAGTLYIVIP